MRIVLDTYVLISGIFFSGPPYEILKAWREKRIQFVITAEIFDEYVRVAEILSNKYATINIFEIRYRNHKAKIILRKVFIIAC